MRVEFRCRNAIFLVGYWADREIVRGNLAAVVFGVTSG